MKAKEEMRRSVQKHIEKSVFKKDFLKKMEILDTEGDGWIFDFKSTFFDKLQSQAMATLLWDEIQKMVPLGKTIAIGGMESGAIPLVSALTFFAPSNVKVTGFFIRKSRKKYDFANDIEGEIPDEAHIVIVDDILNRGNTVLKIQKILEGYNRKIFAYVSVLRFRDGIFYSKEVFGSTSFISLFELDDFKENLGLKNFSHYEKKSSLLKFPLWRVQFCKPNLYHVLPKSTPLFYDGKIFIGADDGSFLSVDSSTGKIEWSYKVSFGAQGKRIYSSPARYNNIIIFGSYDGNLYALDANTGKKEWIFWDGDWIGSSPCVASDINLVFIGLEFGLVKKKGGLAALDARSGKAVWTYYQMDGLTHASPTYSIKHKVVICGCNNNKIYCFGARKGELRWVFETKGEVKYGAVIDEKQGIAYVSSMDGNVYALAVSTGRVIHIFETMAGIYATPALYKGTLIVGSLDKRVYCWDLKSGNMLWRIITGGRIFASPLVYEDKVYIGSNDGKLRVIDSKTGKLIDHILVSERIVNKIVINNDNLYIPTHACELYAFKNIG